MSTPMIIDPEKATPGLRDEEPTTASSGDPSAGTLSSPDEEVQAVVPTAREKPTLQKWNDPKVNTYRFLTTLYSFIVMGMNDACLGALLPYMESYYNISYTVISTLFLVSFVGYFAAALSNSLIHYHLGQRGIAFLGPTSRMIGYILICLHLPFPALPPIMLLPGFGNGIEDSAWNAWIGNMQSANELLGFLHGAYGLGGTLGPLISTAMVAKADYPWWYFFYLMIGLAALEIILASTAFWGARAADYRRTHSSDADGGTSRTTTRAVLKSSVPWLVALFLFGYVGAEVSLGGWITTFMLRVRHAAAFDAGLAVTFFWMGLTIGRVVLGFITGRIGEKLAITGYLLISIALQLMYWLIPSFVASAIIVAFEGFFLGPLFPAAIVALSKLLTSDRHVAAIGFSASFGGGGGAIFPFIVGAIATKTGVEVLQPIILAIFVFILLLWCALPGGMRTGGLEHARETNEKVGHQVKMAYRWLRQRPRKVD